MFLPDLILREKLRKILEEDVGFGDITTEIIVPENLRVKAQIIAKAPGIIAGIEEASILLKELNVNVKSAINDGSNVDAGTVIMEIEGPAKSILICERTVLNLLMRMSGIATLTHQMVEKAKKANPKIIVAGTRKTAPGLRYFDKKAIRIGGGDTHRLRLDDYILIKDNHIVITGGVKEAIKKVKEAASFTKKIGIEVQSVEDALIAAKEGADIIMLDNMKPNEIKKIIKRLKEEGLRSKVLVEASGGIIPDNVEEYAETGVDIISSGYLTHSVKALDISLEITEIPRNTKS
ncbi:MAG: carboxylating nicotinate-nucleotide diphosphorylase [Candidatus Baldrarchaeia archaeon]